MIPVLRGLESLTQGVEIGQFSGPQGLVQRNGEIGLTGVLMGQPQQSDKGAGGFPHGQRRRSTHPMRGGTPFWERAHRDRVRLAKAPGLVRRLWITWW